MQTDTEQIARMYREGIQREAGVEANLTQSSSGKFKVSVRTASQRQQVMAAFGHEKGELALRLNRANLAGDCCMAALLRGAFLACGTLTDPEKDYHLEFVVPYRYISRDLAKLLHEWNLAPKQLERKGSHVVYCKDSERIEEILTLMGAQNAALELMGIKMYKDMRNNINRKINFETANISRTANAAAEQVYAIETILEHAGLESLPSVPLSFGKDGSRSVVLCGQHVLGEELTSRQVNDHVSTIAAIPEVRALLVERQREYNRREPVVMEGRDIGTVVFPDTPFKYFVTASEEVRAARRAAEGLTDSIAERDRKDSSRATAPLAQAPDALLVDTSDMTIDQVVRFITDNIQQKLSSR